MWYNCDKCRKICPARNTIEEKYDKKNLVCYAAKSKDINIIKKSSSGGIFYYLAEKIIRENGIVYGAELVDTKVNHIRITTLSDIKRIHGSKYAQSNLIEILPLIKK